MREAPDLMVIPYAQISLDLGKVGSCETISMAFKPNGNFDGSCLQKDQYLATYLALQQTIDTRSQYFPELVRTIGEIERIAGSDALFLVPLNDPRVFDVLESTYPYAKPLIFQDDIDYCNRRLAQDISADEREVLTRSREYLERELPAARQFCEEQISLASFGPPDISKKPTRSRISGMTLNAI